MSGKLSIFMDREQKVIRSTDYDALSCRVSAHSKEYINDIYLRNVLHGFEKFLKFEYKLSSKRIFNSILSNKMPIINRGTYIRTKSIDIVIDQFIQLNGSKRIINLGSGSDTRVFKLLKDNKDLEMIEIDFPESTKLKHAIIKTDQLLADCIGVEKESPESLEIFYKELPNSLILDNYKLIDLDLRKVSKFEEFLKTLDSDIPTLVISACMLCYTNLQDSTNLINVLVKTFKRLILLIYDPIGGDDNFGQIMIENLKIRNISMPTLLEFNTLEKYSNRLLHLGFDKVKGSNMFNILNSWINASEKRRISKLEFLDEIEELKLLLEHYCLILSIKGINFESLKFDLNI